MEFRNSKGQFVKGKKPEWFEEKKRLSLIGFNRRHSEETKRKISLKHKGQLVSEEWRKNLSLAHKGLVSVKELSRRGKLGALKRWANHVKVDRTYHSLNNLKTVNLELKRFHNQRYKARKRNAIGKHTFNQWVQLKVKYNFMCLCCKKFEPEIKLSEDHIIPLSMGGSDQISNIQPLCISCNTKKHTKTTSYLPLSPNDLIHEGKGLIFNGGQYSG